MDAEVTLWSLLFVGSYSAVLALLLRVAFAKKKDS